MKRFIAIWLVLAALSATSLWAKGGHADVLPGGNEPLSADSILKQVVFYAPVYETLVTGYKAEMYMKNHTYMRRRNFLMRYMPSMFKVERGVKEYLCESYGDLHFTAPNIHDYKTKASVGTMKNHRGPNAKMLEFFHINVYATSLLSNKLLSPISPSGTEYYEYRLDSVMKRNKELTYRISFRPRKQSYQLVEGYMIVTDGVWSVRELQFSGRSEYLKYDNRIVMGKTGDANEFLPVRQDMNATFSFLGNVIDTRYTVSHDYKDIQITERRSRPKKERKNYDLTESFTLRSTPGFYQTDTMRFAQLRPFALTPTEERIYRNYYQPESDSTFFEGKKKNASQVFWGEVGDMLVNNYTLDLAQYGDVRTSPLLNPMLLNYSRRDGVTYSYELRYNRMFNRHRLIRSAPRIGYNFKHKELYWQVNNTFDYWPHKRAAIHLNVGKGNLIYSSKLLDELKEIPDSVFDFNKIHLDYFKDFYVDLRHSLELTNGLTLEAGVAVHRRSAVKKSEFVPIDPETPPEHPDEEVDVPEITEKFRNTYISFAPRIRLVWTPGQYYYMNGPRKVNLHSKYPTFTLDYERGIKGVLGSTGSHERWELDMQHRVSLGLLRTIYYRLGCGTFTKQDQLYFVDFANFSKRNLPVGWNDDIGGVFQNLDRRWYNSSREYVRANFTYEAPFLLLPFLFRNTKHVLNERLYLGGLVVPHLHPYLEAGYGIGTHVCDAGIFVSSINGKFHEVGFKLTFELFNR